MRQSRCRRDRLLAALLAAAPASAGAYEDAIAAYDRAIATGAAADYAAALALLRPEAAAGNASASDLLGRAYRDSHGVPPDALAAENWFERGAVQGDAAAEADLAALLAAGAGVPADPVAATMWFSLAVLHGDTAAAAGRDALAASLSPTDRAEAERRIRDWVPIAID